jgi:hypothetical protein
MENIRCGKGAVAVGEEEGGEGLQPLEGKREREREIHKHTLLSLNRSCCFTFVPYHLPFHSNDTYSNTE